MAVIVSHFPCSDDLDHVEDDQLVNRKPLNRDSSDMYLYIHLDWGY